MVSRAARPGLAAVFLNILNKRTENNRNSGDQLDAKCLKSQ